MKKIVLTLTVLCCLSLVMSCKSETTLFRGTIKGTHTVDFVTSKQPVTVEQPIKLVDP